MVQVGSKKCFSLSGVPVRPRTKPSMPWMRLISLSSKGNASRSATSSADAGRTWSQRPSMVMRSFASLSVASAQTRRQAGFGMIVACDECTSCFAPRTRSSK